MSRSGNRLYFVEVRTTGATLMAAEVRRTGDRVAVVGMPKTVFEGETLNFPLEIGGFPLYDMLGDGSQLLIVERSRGGTPEVVRWEGWTVPAD